MTTPLAPAVTPAVPVWSDAQTVVGQVAAPEYPGPVTTDHSGSPEGLEYQGSPQGPVAGQAPPPIPYEPPPYFPDIPGSPGDTGALYGHAAPIAAFDSNAGGPFAGSGPVAAGVHEFDTGGTQHESRVLMPKVGSWWRRALSGQTWNRTVTYDPTGKYVAAPNNRTDLDQYQGHNADASDPRWIPYSERPVKLNIAHEPIPAGTDQPATAYTPALDLSPVGPQFWTDQSSIYESPPDPEVATQSSQQSQQSSVLDLMGWS